MCTHEGVELAAHQYLHANFDDTRLITPKAINLPTPERRYAIFTALGIIIHP